MGLKTVNGTPARALKGRGAAANPEGRFEHLRREDQCDDHDRPRDDEDDDTRPRTTVTVERARGIITRNQSPDVPFNLSINPYRGCEHGCIYCYARPSHAYLELSPGLDFETRLFAKDNAAQLLREELARPGHRVEPIAIGVNTDAYQPIERERRITRRILEVLAECEHPCTLVTKNALIERDLDLLVPMASKHLVQVFISVTTLDASLARRMEPRASAPGRRLEAVRRLAEAGVPVGVMVAPVIPFLTDSELESILEAAHVAGAQTAGYVLLRLPWEVKDLFQGWLDHHYPLKAAHVMSRVREMRGGRENDPNFGSRMRGDGLFAQLLGKRFAVACSRLGLNRERRRTLDCTRFRPPRSGPQLDLF
ncbi:MAG: PA0069 family radical SAM protein [Burkholderiales bacterium]|nr:PA0069 family radical SAM protein [Burkholderiales bacterium]